MESDQHQRREFESEGAKLRGDAQGLIAKAKVQSEKLGVAVDPIVFTQRKDDDIEALRAAIAKGQRAVNPEAVELDPRLAIFKADFDEDPAIRGKCSWAEIQTRLLANEGHYLALAKAMNEGGILFGVDTDGNPLFADRGDEPIMKGMNYKDTRDRILYKHDASDKMITDEDGQPVPTGYAMFQYSGNYDKSEEILQYESHTGKPFIKSSDFTKSTGEDPCSSWVESGENPLWRPGIVYFNWHGAYARGGHADPQNVSPNCGVRRLLRVKKA